VVPTVRADAGTINQLVHLRKFDDDADRRAHWTALFAYSAFMDGFAAKCHPLVQSQEVKLLIAALSRVPVQPVR